MSIKLIRPVDPGVNEFDQSEHCRLMERFEFESDLEFGLYSAKVFYEAFNDIPKAIEILEKLEEQYPHDASVKFALAECLSRTKESSEKALQLCEIGLGLDSNSAYGFTIQARIYAAIGNVDEAYRSCMNALKIDRSLIEPAAILGVTGFWIAKAEGDLREMYLSVKNLEIALGKYPDSKYLANLFHEYKKRYEKESGNIFE